MPQEIRDVRSLQRRLENLSQYGLRSGFQDPAAIPFRVPNRVPDELMSTWPY